jgi:DNA gyrase/topoisomerase IV subunit B
MHNDKKLLYRKYALSKSDMMNNADVMDGWSHIESLLMTFLLTHA